MLIFYFPLLTTIYQFIFLKLPAWLVFAHVSLCLILIEL
jgi:hypothetical protein